MNVNKKTSGSRSGLLKRKSVTYGARQCPIPAESSEQERSRCAPEPESRAEEEPSVELHRGPDGTVSAITVRCSCGNEITLQCEYLGEGGPDET